MAEYCDKCGMHHNRKALLMAGAILNGKKTIETSKGRQTLCSLAKMIDFEDVGEKRYAEYWFIRREVVDALKKEKIKATEKQIDEAIPFIDKKISEVILFLGGDKVIAYWFKDFMRMTEQKRKEILDAITIK